MLADLQQALIQDVNARGPQAAAEFAQAFQTFVEFMQQLIAQSQGAPVGAGQQAAAPPPQAGIPPQGAPPF
jgi:hypothetical protein